MSTVVEQENEIALIQVSQYVTDSEGRRIAAIVNIEELRRVEELIEDVHDLRIVAERENEPDIDFKEYCAKTKARMNVQSGV
ncbi:MAG: hypothetical protein HQL03_12555 [Nitrospirae bacterium]|nr:hypothetical protein [Nitrospirota bacterium]MBF0591475.1 hypothetical protein [Nitrospirota bacterium]